MRVDCHNHVLPAPYLELFAQDLRPPSAVRRDDGWIISYGGLQEFVVTDASYSVEAKLAEMDRLQIDVAILSTNIPGPELLPSEQSANGARIVNEFIAQVVAAHPARFAGLACLPWQQPEQALAELDHADRALGLRGVMLYSHVDGQPVDSPSFEVIYEQLAARGLPLVLHPTVPSWGEAIKEHAMIPMLGFQVDTSFALLRLILGGVLDRHPDLKVVMPHAGGVLPYMMGRIEHQVEKLKRGGTQLTRPPRDYFDQIYFDTVTPSPQTLAFACEFCGPARMLFGTDTPWVDPALIIDCFEALELSQSARDAIYADNAIKLFGLDAQWR